MTVLLVFAIVCGVLGALIMQSKNRSPLAGAAVGFLFSLVGLLVLACFSKRPAPELDR